jgi:hypothetical protein
MRNWQRKIVKNINISIDTRSKNSGRKKEDNINYKERCKSQYKNVGKVENKNVGFM